MTRWKFRVRGWNAHGLLLLETVHSTEGSKDMEVAAWEARKARGEGVRYEVIDCRRNGQ